MPGGENVETVLVAGSHLNQSFCDDPNGNSGIPSADWSPAFITIMRPATARKWSQSETRLIFALIDAVKYLSTGNDLTGCI